MTPAFDMKQLTLTGAEYEALLRISVLAEWILEPLEPLHAEAVEPCRRLIQKILGMAGRFGYGDAVAVDKRRRDYWITEQFENEDPAAVLMNDYEDMVFWDVLADRLAEREMLHTLGEEKVQAMNDEAFQSMRQALRERYYKEFEDSGLDNLRIAGLAWGRVRRHRTSGETEDSPDDG